MRLSVEQIRSIIQATHALAGDDAQVRLFGSRLQDHLIGGDIDLLVEFPKAVARPVWLAAQITARLQRALGDLKIDVLVLDPATATALEPVHRNARADGVLLQAWRNLDRAGRLGLMPQTSETWLAARAPRNRMVHEYIRSPAVLAEAVNAAHEQVPMLVAFAQAVQRYVDMRQLLD